MQNKWQERHYKIAEVSARHFESHDSTQEHDFNPN